MLISQICTCSSDSCVLKVRVPGGEHIVRLITASKKLQFQHNPSSNQLHPQDKKPEAQEEGQEASRGQLGVSLGTRVRESGSQVLFLVTHRKCDITGKDKESRFGQFQQRILLHPNFAAWPFMHLVTEKGQIAP